VSLVFKDLTNAIRFLSIDAVQKANSGHPGLPMGMADVATILFKYYLRFNPKNPSWINRDRFVLSAGHGSMLLYSLLYLTGYKSISIKDIQNFRQLKSICAGHPEYKKKSGIETTTGPLGQGLSNAIGMAIAEEVMKKRFGSNLINHRTYVIASDGDFMEGISHEAMSLAGHLKLKNLVVFFDNNKISIDGSTKLAVSDNYKKRFESYGWNFQEVNGHNEKQISKAIKKTLKSKKPSLISCKTIIGYGSPNKSGKASSHGAALGDEEVALVRKKLKWKYKPFEIPKEILNEWREIGKRGDLQEKKWTIIHNKKSMKVKNEYLRGSEKSKLIYNYSALTTNVVMNYVKHKTDGNWEKLLHKVFNEHVGVKNSVYFQKSKKYLKTDFDSARYSFYATRYDYLRIAKAMLDDWHNDTCAGKYLKTIYKNRIKKKDNTKEPDDVGLYTKTYGGQFHFDIFGLKKTRKIIGMSGFAGQQILIDLDNKRIIVVNSLFKNYNWRKIVHSEIKKGK